MKLIRYLLGLSLFLLAGQWVKADETAAESFNPQKSIFEHLGDEYGWNVWNLHIPLPVIVRDEEGAWHVFSSAKLAGGQEYEGFYIAGEGEYEGKVIARNASGHIYRPWDFSVTKNVLALFLFFHGLLSPFLNVDAPENIIVFCAVSGASVPTS